MSTTRNPTLGGRQRPANIAVLLREAFVALNDEVRVELDRSGHGDIRPAHSAVFQFLDDTGTRVSVLADRAQMTKQAMAELVAHLEAHDYVAREPDPADRRAKLVVPTPRGREVFAIAQGLVPQMEKRLTDIIGPRRMTALRKDLDAIRTALTRKSSESPGTGRRRASVDD